MDLPDGPARIWFMRRRLLVFPAALLLLGLTAVGGSTRAVTRYGVSFTLPAGWDASVERGAWRLTGAPGVTVKLFEDTPDSAWSPGLETRFYRQGQPRPFTAGQLAGRGPRRNFALAGRYFDFFVLGTSRSRESQLAQINGILRSLRVQPGDFYRGRVAPARFRPAGGWHVRHQGSSAVGTENWIVTVASTVPWRDALNNAVPTRSLARLRPTDGVAIFVSLQADNRFPPANRSTRLRLGPLGQYATCGPSVPGVSTKEGAAAVSREYGYSVEVVYGRVHPTVAQRARVRAELARLVLPRWPRWS